MGKGPFWDFSTGLPLEASCKPHTHNTTAKKPRKLPTQPTFQAQTLRLLFFEPHTSATAFWARGRDGGAFPRHARLARRTRASDARDDAPTRGMAQEGRLGPWSCTERREVERRWVEMRAKVRLFLEGGFGGVSGWVGGFVPITDAGRPFADVLRIVGAGENTWRTKGLCPTGFWRTADTPTKTLCRPWGCWACPWS